MWRGRVLLKSSPAHSLISALSVREVRVQEHVLIDSAHQAVNVGCHLLIWVDQRQHDVQSFLSVAWQVPPVDRTKDIHWERRIKTSYHIRSPWTGSLGIWSIRAVLQGLYRLFCKRKCCKCVWKQLSPVEGKGVMKLYMRMSHGIKGRQLVQCFN